MLHLTDEQIQSIIDYDEQYSKQYFTFQIGCDLPLDERLQAFSDTLTDIDDQVLILMEFDSDIEFDEAITATDEETYLILDDDDADTRAMEAAESYADEAIYEIPQHLQHYFNDAQYIEDLLSDSGRGWLLAGYNGEEVEVTFKGIQYYIYRQN